MSIQWSQSLSTHLPQLDEQHRQMIKLLNELVDAITQNHGQQTVTSVLHAMRVYADEHFACEETCMDRHHCPTAAINRTEHNQFRKMIADFEARLSREGVTDALAMQVEEQLAVWVIQHIGSVDRELAHCVPAA
jgi:hemerythrin